MPLIDHVRRCRGSRSIAFLGEYVTRSICCVALLPRSAPGQSDLGLVFLGESEQRDTPLFLGRAARPPRLT